MGVKMIMVEEWKILEENEKYIISNLGNVKKIGKSDNISLLIAKNKWSGLYLGCYIDNCLRRVDTLVAKTFISNPENKRYVIHIDRDLANCRVDNLSWANRFELLLDRYPDDVMIFKGIEFHRYFHNGVPTNYFISKFGSVFSANADKIIKLGKTLKGYSNVCVTLPDGSRVPVTVHKMVGMTFLKDSWKAGYDIDHLNGIKTDNRVENLEWVTRSVNIRRAFKNGLKITKHGDAHGATKYTDSMVRSAFESIRSGDSPKIAAQRSGIPVSYLYTILRGEIRKYFIIEYPDIIHSSNK